MRAVRAHYPQELDEYFIRVDTRAVTDVPILAANLAELAWPVGQDGREPSIGKLRISGAPAAVKAASHGPTAVRTVFERGIQAESALCLRARRARELIARAPDEFVSEENGVVDGTPQGFPA